MCISASKTQCVEREEKAECTTMSTEVYTPTFYKQDTEVCIGKNSSLVKPLPLHSSRIYFPSHLIYYQYLCAVPRGEYFPGGKLV